MSPQISFRQGLWYSNSRSSIALPNGEVLGHLAFPPSQDGVVGRETTGVNEASHTVLDRSMGNRAGPVRISVIMGLCRHFRGPQDHKCRMDNYLMPSHSAGQIR